MRVANPIGKKGEDEASIFLQKKRYKVIERNFRGKNGEVDIIASTNNVLVFVEVKTRTSSKFGTPFEAITHWKLEALVRTAQFYKATHKYLPDEMRIDAISVMLDEANEVKSIEHIENISGF